MGKRSNFQRVEKDFYPTPKEAVLPLVSWFQRNSTNVPTIKYIEPCVGNGDLVNHLNQFNFECIFSSDVELDARSTQYKTNITNSGIFITNPPWSRDLLHPIIENLRKQAATWLLFDADWMHTKQAIPYMKYCTIILSVGRVKWIPNSKYTGKDNCCWYCFTWDDCRYVKFIGRI